MKPKRASLNRATIMCSLLFVILGLGARKLANCWRVAL
jgi:hypothetical protein